MKPSLPLAALTAATAASSVISVAVHPPENTTAEFDAENHPVSLALSPAVSLEADTSHFSLDSLTRDSARQSVDDTTGPASTETPSTIWSSGNETAQRNLLLLTSSSRTSGALSDDEWNSTRRAALQAGFVAGVTLMFAAYVI
jgi:hypothetical protein